MVLEVPSDERGASVEEVNSKLATIKDAANRAELQRIRQLIKTYLPEVTEQISYGMPAFKYKGKYLIAYWAFKDHLSLFPGSESVEILASDLGSHATSKGTVQFTLSDLISDKLILQMVDLRVKAIDQVK